jgi:hypothetical protein
MRHGRQGPEGLHSTDHSLLSCVHGTHDSEYAWSHPPVPSGYQTVSQSRVREPKGPRFSSREDTVLAGRQLSKKAMSVVFHAFENDD